MSWNVSFHPKFDAEFDELTVEVRRELVSALIMLREYGPLLGRPHVDTLKDSKFSNRKELRFTTDGGVWRVAFAFDPTRDAILLVAGDKAGGSEKTFSSGSSRRRIYGSKSIWRVLGDEEKGDAKIEESR